MALKLFHTSPWSLIKSPPQNTHTHTHTHTNKQTNKQTKTNQSTVMRLSYMVVWFKIMALKLFHTSPWSLIKSPSPKTHTHTHTNKQTTKDMFVWFKIMALQLFHKKTSCGSFLAYLQIILAATSNDAAQARSRASPTGTLCRRRLAMIAAWYKQCLMIMHFKIHS